MDIKGKLKRFVKRVVDAHILRIPPRGINLYSDIRYNLPSFPVSVIFDVGANVGQSAQNLLRRFPAAQIYCFEPATATCAALQRKFKHAMNVHCLRLALGASKGEGNLLLENRSVNNSLSSSDSHGKETERVDIGTVTEFCRDNNIRRINFLKIDTEGYDLNVLMGAVGMLDKKEIDLVDVEAGMNPRNQKHVPFEKLKEFLETRGYFLFGIYEQTSEFFTGEPNMRRSNTVFISDSIIKSNTAVVF